MNEQNPAVDLAEAVRVLGLCAVEGDTYAAAVLAGLEARGAAIERVRAVCTDRAELDHSRGWMVRAGEVIAALDGGAPGERQ